MKSKEKPIIKLEGLTRDFGAFRAVDELSLSVPPGIVFGFLGPNGAGKTTTIRMLLGLMAPTAGRAHVLGFDTQTQADQIRANTGALLEHSGVYEHMSAADNLEFYGRVYRIPVRERQACIKEALTQMKLWERRTEPVGKWSRGMKQRLALGRSLLHQPPLVFLDEPTAGLDVIAANAVREDIAELVARGGTTVFLTTHNMAEAEKLCSQVAVIRAGKLVALGSPTELMAYSGESRIDITGAGFTPELVESLQARSKVIWAKGCNGHLQLCISKGTSISPLVSLLVSAGARIEEVHHEKTSLEQAFLDLMKEEV